MLTSLIRQFSRISPIKTKNRSLENIINVSNDVKFHKRTNTSTYIDPYEKESREIDQVFSSKFDRKTWKNNRNNIFTSSTHSDPDHVKTSESSNPTFKDTDFFDKNENSHNIDEKYNFEIEPDEFFQFDTFESMKKNSRYQDLTHEERQCLQELEVKSKLKDPFNTLNTNKAKINPEKDAKFLLRESSKSEKSSEPQDFQIELIGETEETELMDKRLLDQNKFDEVVSRIRTKIRLENKANSDINKLKIPNINGIVVDPIKKHVMRRAARIGTMLHTHIEQIFTCNDPEFLYKHLNGASISINHVEMPTSKSNVKCYYNILSKHDPDEVQKNLDMVAPKVRFMIARKLELGYTPPVKFIKYNRTEFINVKKRSQLLESAFNLTLEGSSGFQPNKLLDEPNSSSCEEKVVIRDDQITPEMNEFIQESFHRRYYGYP